MGLAALMQSHGVVDASMGVIDQGFNKMVEAWGRWGSSVV